MSAWTSLLWDLVRTAFHRPDEIQIDTQILRVHSRISFRVFLICSVVLTLRQVIGTDDIMCYNHGTSTTKDETLNAFCWTQGTYSVLEYFHRCDCSRKVEPLCKEDCIYPGVGQLYFGHPTRFHTYYIWTSAVLFLQAIISYIPRFVWKHFENGLQRNLAYDRKLLFYPIIPGDEDGDGYKAHKENLANYFVTHRGQHQNYFYVYCFSEILGLLCTIANIFITDVLLQNQFSTYGMDVISYWLYKSKDVTDVSPMVKVFPYLTKCKPPSRYGPSGNIFSPDPICVLPLNALNDKIYLFLWFYLYFIVIISVISLFYRMLTLFFNPIRLVLIKSKYLKVKPNVLEDLCRCSQSGDWFVLYILNRNVSNEFFREFLEGYWEALFHKEISV